MLFRFLRGMTSNYPAEYFVKFLLIIEFFSEVILQIFNFNSFLLHGVTVTYGNGSILFGIKIIGNTEWCTNLILTAISLSDISSVIKFKIICFAEFCMP